MSAQSLKEHCSSPGCIQYLREVFVHLAKSIAPDDRDEVQPFFVSMDEAELGEYSVEQIHYQVIFSETDQFLAIGCDGSEHLEYLFFGSYLVDKFAIWLRDNCTVEELLEEGFSLFSDANIPLSEEQAAAYIYDWAKRDICIALEKAFGIDVSVINRLSLSTQEKEEVKGNLLFSSNCESEQNICAWMMEDRKFNFEKRNLRLIGKLMAGTAPKHGLLFNLNDDCPTCVGVVEEAMLSSIPLHVTIQGPLQWQLVAFQRPILQYIHGEAHLPNVLTDEEKRELQENRIKNHLCNVFHLEESSSQLSVLTRTVLSISRQDHGAAAVVADWDKGKCKKRLQKLIKYGKAIPVCVQTPLDDMDVLTRAAKMDGAVIINANSGQVVALAAILDGLTCVQGNPSRGARYNSVRNFTKSFNVPMASFVFSSDGGIDLFSAENAND